MEGRDIDASLALSIGDLKIISGTLENIICNSFGPKGKSVLIRTSSGQVVVTKDSGSIFRTLHFPHPAAQCIVDSVFSFEKMYGDGSKTFITYLHSLLCSVDSIIKKQREESAERLKISKCLHNYLQDEFLHVVNIIKACVMKSNMNFFRLKSREELVHEQFLKLASTCMGTYLLPGNATKMSKVVMDYLLDKSSTKCSSVKEQIESSYKWFQQCHVISCGLPYDSSFVDDGIFLEKDFLFKGSAQNPCHFILMKCSIEDSYESERNYTLNFHSGGNEETFIKHKIRTAQCFLLSLKEKNISLILSSDTVPDYVLQLCQSLDISIVCSLEDADIDFLSFTTGIPAVTSVRDDFVGANVKCQISCEKMLYGSKVFLKFVPFGTFNQWKPRSIFLCGPTKGMCQQLKTVVQNCIKVIRNCAFNSHVSSMSDRCENLMEKDEAMSHLCIEQNIIAGGAYFEFLAVHILKKIYRQTNCVEKRTMCDILIPVFQNFAKNLYNCVSAGTNFSRHNFASLLMKVTQAQEWDQVIGFNDKGQLCDPREHGIWDCLNIKIVTVFSVLSLCSQLLRVDSLVPVTALSVLKMNRKDKSDDT